MDRERFDRFREESEILIRSQNWLTTQMDKIVVEFDNLPPDLSDTLEEEHDIAKRMEFWQLKAEWEERESKRFAEKYKDII